MSNHLISTVYKRHLGTHMRKSVMALLADKASDDGSGIWASKQTLADELCCSKQTVIATIKGFIADGLIVESGARKCATGATTEYRIVVEALEALPLVACHAKRSSALTGQAASPVKMAYARGQAAGPKPSLTLHPQNASHSSDKRAREFAPPPDVPERIWRDFLNSPKRRKAGMSPTAYSRIVGSLHELAEHGFPPGEMIGLAVERGWTTVKLDWVMNDERKDLGRSGGRMVGPGTDPTLAIYRAALEAQREGA